MSSLLQADEARALLRASVAGDLPDERGRFGPFGGRYVAETLMPAIIEDVFVHFRSIQGKGHRSLGEGQRVVFSVTEGDKGLQAVDVSSA